MWIAVGLAVGLVRRRSFILLRLLGFAWFYFGFELIALFLIGIVFLVRPSGAARDDDEGQRVYEQVAKAASHFLGHDPGFLGSV